ncbi:GNAT family N-acetyltransferase [Bacillus sp. FSL K6-2839]|uniref:GNAT family N-acetyltransferase n=1 Tax=Bacillus sp. FSL K6-2839 TaxID=2921480 RepID=UPI0030F8D0AA
MKREVLVRSSESCIEFTLGDAFSSFYHHYDKIKTGGEFMSRQIERIQRSVERCAKDEAYMHGIFLNETDDLIGTISLSSVVRGPVEGAWLGYVLDEKHGGKGYMTEAIRLIIDYAFDELHLHRIEAGVKPSNIGSIRVLEKTGFENEGLNRKKVKINGVWEDHYLFAIIHPDES